MISSVYFFYEFFCMLYYSKGLNIPARGCLQTLTCCDIEATLGGEFVKVGCGFRFLLRKKSKSFTHPTTPGFSYVRMSSASRCHGPLLFPKIRFVPFLPRHLVGFASLHPPCRSTVSVWANRGSWRGISMSACSLRCIKYRFPLLNFSSEIS